MCPKLCSVRYLSNWKGVTRIELMQFWKEMRENNVDIDFGEKEWKEVSITELRSITTYLQDMERRKERDEMSKNKMKASFCSTDVLSKMFGTTYQEGEGYSEGDKHIFVNAFPQEGEGHRL